MTLREIFNAITGYTKDRENLTKITWDSARFQVMHLLTPHIKKGARLKPTDIVKFPWDGREKVNTVKQVDRGKELASKWRKSINE